MRKLALLSRLRIGHCHEWWYRSQMQLKSLVAVVVVQVSGYSYDSTPSLGTSICHGDSPKKTKKQNKTKQKNNPELIWHDSYSYTHTHTHTHTHTPVCSINYLQMFHNYLSIVEWVIPPYCDVPSIPTHTSQPLT